MPNENTLDIVGPGKSGVIQTRKHMGNVGVTFATAGQTVSTLTTSEAPYTAVRIVLYNASTTTVITGTKVTISPSAAIGDGYTPTDALGAPLTPTPVTWNNSGVDGEWPSPSGSTLTFSVPMSTGSGPDIIPGEAYSDWMPIASLPRIDGGSLPLLLVRMYSTNRVPLHSAVNGQWGTPWALVDQGRKEISYYTSGDRTVSGFTAPTPLENGIHMAVQFVGRRGLSVLGCGDSLTLGQSGSNGSWANSWGHQACVQLSTPEFPVMWANFGSGGQTSPVFYARAKNYIDKLRPDVIVIPCWSPNDGNITTDFGMTSLTAALLVADYAVRKGIVPILTTPMPLNYSGTAPDNARKALAARIREMSSSFIIADFDAIVTDGGSPAHPIPAYDSGDQTHLNDFGYAALSLAVRSALQKIIYSRPRGAILLS